jgi:hypothetical protein
MGMATIPALERITDEDLTKNLERVQVTEHHSPRPYQSDLEPLRDNDRGHEDPSPFWISGGKRYLRIFVNGTGAARSPRDFPDGPMGRGMTEGWKNTLRAMFEDNIVLDGPSSPVRRPV